MTIARVDQHFTPPELAAKVAEALRLGDKRFDQVADFAAGGGSLLDAAESVLAPKSVIATDLDGTVVRHLREVRSHWSIGKVDFLSHRSRAVSGPIRLAKRGVDGIVLNPPFSYRGGSYVSVRIDNGRVIRASPAMAFLLVSSGLLSRNGVIASLVPASLISSQKDEEAREYLSLIGTVDVLELYPRGSFPGVTTSLALARFQLDLTRQGRLILSMVAPRVTTIPIEVKVTRGWRQMHMDGVRPEGSMRIPLVHTTDLRDLRSLASLQTCWSKRVITGPAVLLPRVGRPDINKVVAVDAVEGGIALSDCVVALECRSFSDAEKVRKRIADDWDMLESSYKGSCAPYLTLRALGVVLRKLAVVTALDCSGEVLRGEQRSIVSVK